VAGAYLTADSGRALVKTTIGYTLSADWPGWALAVALVVLLLGMTWHVVDHERGAQHTATDWALTVTGGLYLGLCAAHYVLIREGLGPDGRWWALIVLPAQWIADSAALF